MDAGLTEVSIEVLETEVLNDTAYATGSYTFRDDEGETVAEGYLMAILTPISFCPKIGWRWKKRMAQAAN